MERLSYLQRKHPLHDTKARMFHSQLIACRGQIEEKKTPLVITLRFPDLIVFEVGQFHGRVDDSTAGIVLNVATERSRANRLLPRKRRKCPQKPQRDGRGASKENTRIHTFPPL